LLLAFREVFFMHHLVKPTVLAAAAMLSACATQPPVTTAKAEPGKPSLTQLLTQPAAPTAATPPAPAASGAKPAPGAAPAATPPATPPAPGTPPPFATVIKDAKKLDGLITLWQKDDKVWLELKPEDFNKPFFFSPKIAQGIGESFLFGGLMLGNWSGVAKPKMFEFRRVHKNLVQMVALNTDYIARDPNSPEGRAVAAAFSPSLMSAASVASAEHPERKTVLVDAAPLLLTDVLGLGMNLQRIYRQNYALESRNTFFDSVRAQPDQVVFNVKAHYATGNIAVPTPGLLPPGAPLPSVPSTLPDPRSMVVGLYYAIAALPEKPMAARLADSRVGYFTTSVSDFSTDNARTPRQRFVNRWRLEKKDPQAALSEPVKPITYWLDRNIPVKYRASISKGILEWNKAFEKIGFKDAIVVKQQPDDADFDTLDVGVASVKWMTNAKPSFGAIGPSQVDPRSGEILDADIGFESLSSRSVRTLRSQLLAHATGASAAQPWRELMQLPADDSASPSHAVAHHHGPQCNHGAFAAEQLGYALEVLESRGEVDPDSPEAEQFVQDYLLDTTMHEVGHTLGLRHNFRSSRIYTEKQLSDAEFTAKNGLAGSVMEYAPINLPRAGETGGTRFQLALGPYDFWAIEYAYKPIAPEQEKAELQKIAARSADPLLAYATDEDNSLGYDPEALVFDLGDDPVAFAKKRLDITRDLIARQETRALKPENDYAVLRRSVTYALRDSARAVGILVRQIGGLRTLRDHPGSGREPLVPVPAAVQRDALDSLIKNVMSANAISLSPALQRKLAPDYAERGEQAASTDFNVEDLYSGLQRSVLAYLMSDGLSSRLMDNESKLERGSANALRVSELHSRLTTAVWSELGAGGGKGDIPAIRRDLQREHVNRIAMVLLRPSLASRADIRSVTRQQATQLLARIRSASRAGLSAESQAHLADSAETLQLAMDAKMVRLGL
jgi:hypothetical protein